MVYGTRTERPCESAFKLATARGFYRLLNNLSEIPIPLDTGDFRLMSRNVVATLRAMPKRDRFMRGMVSWTGFRQMALPYRRAERFAGQSKYRLRKMLRFATDGILSFSTRPLQLSVAMGMLCGALALLGIVYAATVTIVGAGFTGLASAYELAKQGIAVTVLEAESKLGGLAAAFDVGGEKLDRFYHHWFTNDLEIMGLIDELGLNARVEISPTNTGVYYANNFFKLSTPWDLLNFTPLGFTDRIRLGLLALRARRVKDWRLLEDKTAQEWLKELGGENVYRIVWKPLLKGKFGPYAEQVSAVWFWNKLKLRGGSRGKGGEERLAYFKGGFVALAEALAARITALGGTIALNTRITRIEPVNGRWHTTTDRGTIVSERVVATTALPLVADMVRDWATPDCLASLERIQYSGNVCLVLELDRPLSKTYWLNVNEPSFPFVGVIEHTNFERPETYGGRHIVYLSKYLPHTDRLYSMNADEFLEFALPYMQTMFPAMKRDWIQAHHLWRARWSQPVVEKHYSHMIPAEDGPKPGFHICSMAQIYPEDRGTNYAIREGRKIGVRLAGEITA